MISTTVAGLQDSTPAIHVQLFDENGKSIAGFRVVETEDEIKARFTKHVLSGDEDVFVGQATDDPDSTAYVVRMSNVAYIQMKP